MVSFAIKHEAVTSSGTGRKVHVSRRMGSSTGRTMPTRKHYEIAMSYNIDEQNGSTPATVNVVFPGAKYAALDYTPTRTGYRFLGWYDAASGGNAVDKADQVAYDRATIYAHWQDHVTVTFDATTNGGAMPSGWVAPYYFAGQPYGTLPQPTHASLNFGGWYDAGGNRVTSSSIVPQNGGTLTARYVAASFTVNLNDEWRSQSPNTNPAPGDYDGVYESFSNWHVDDWGTSATMSIELVGYSEFTLYIKCVTDDYWSYCYCTSSTGALVQPEKSQEQIEGEARAAEYREQGYNVEEWSESGYTYVDVYDDNWEWIDGFSYPAVAPGTAYPGSGSDHSVGSYVPVTFTFANPASNVINVTYYKSESGDWMGEDRGYVLIPYVQGGA